MSTHSVTLVFEDGRIVKFDASEDDNIYFACLKNKVRILTDCLEGACATCKGVCTSGTYYLGEYTDEALTAEEFDKGEVLTCQMHVTSDCVIEFPYESRIALKSKLGFQSNPGFIGEFNHAIGRDVHLTGQHFSFVELLGGKCFVGILAEIIGAGRANPLAGGTGAFETVRQNANLVLQAGKINVVVFASVEFDDPAVFEHQRYRVRTHFLSFRHKRWRSNLRHTMCQHQR